MRGITVHAAWYDYKPRGSVAELADAADLKSAAFGLVGSSPTAPTRSINEPTPIPLHCKARRMDSNREVDFREAERPVGVP